MPPSPASDPSAAAPPGSAVLIGPASIDRYVDDEGRLSAALPGGGALNMAYHWMRDGVATLFVTRVGDDDGRPLLDFMDRHGIAHLPAQVMTPGRSASIDIAVRADRQPAMSNFVEGVWSGFRLDLVERDAVTAARRLHAVLVEPVIAELHTLGAQGLLTDVEVSADFLSFVHYDLDRFAATMRHVDLAFIGWPGRRDDPTVDGIRRVVEHLGKLACGTMGAAGVRVLDGRRKPPTRRWEPVTAVEVIGTTVGCGDAFIAAFLARWWAGDGLAGALAAGRSAGAAATGWARPLPDDAYA